MSTLALSDSLMGIATKEVGLAMWVLPPASMIYFEFKLSTGKAAELDKAGQEWRKAAEQIEKLCTDLQQSVTAIAAQDWSGQDRPAYEGKVDEFTSQMEVLQTYCQAVGIALTALAYSLMVYAVFAAAMGTFLAALAAAVIAAAASVVGSPSIAGMQATAATCGTITHVATAILAAAGQMGALTMAGGAMLSAVAETARGNDQALGDFMQAQATGSAAALSTLAQNGANAGLTYVNRYQDAVAPANVKLPKGVPLQSVDLDADRNYDRTWNVGGGATVDAGPAGEHEVNGHVKYGDRGWQGADAEYKYTNPAGVSAGAKVGAEEDKDGNWVYSGGVNGGYTHEPTGTGATTGAEGTYNSGTNAWTAKGEGTAQYQGGDVYKQSHEASNDGHGNTEWKHETKTPTGDHEKPPWDL